MSKEQQERYHLVIRSVQRNASLVMSLQHFADPTHTFLRVLMSLGDSILRITLLHFMECYVRTPTWPQPSSILSFFSLAHRSLFFLSALFCVNVAW